MRNNTDVPKIFTGFLLGVFIASSAALIANIYLKVSMHSIGVGGLLGIFYLIMQRNTMLMTWPMAIAILICGLVCTARLMISDHQPKEIIVGLIIGILTQSAGVFIAG
ncbi:MAG: phosphatase PAP2 family protein [Chitinophagaceae bacterium]|nr:phosphatase PAP2 family protein [Chitinophagaceae bacterium]